MFQTPFIFFEHSKVRTSFSCALVFELFNQMSIISLSQKVVCLVLKSSDNWCKSLIISFIRPITGLFWL
jgi:hypothetical protein